MENSSMQKTFITLAFIAAAAFAFNALAGNPPSNNPSMPSTTTVADPAKKTTGSTPSTMTQTTTPSTPSTMTQTTKETTIGTMSGSFKLDMIQAWPTESKQAAEAIIAKYGMPTEFTSSMLVWEQTGPWKKTVVMKEAVDHQFPIAHKDVLKQVVDYKVPADKTDELAQFDGSIIVDRTKGELAVRCDKEENNFLAINLADEIIKGKKTVKQARDMMAKAVTGKQLAGNEGMFKDGLKFQLATSSTADADKSIPMGQ
jgi:hypothetical protein